MKTARSFDGMVVAAHPLAAEAGKEILSEGGNAVEAAVAVSLMLGVVEPQASGLGGGGVMLVAPRGAVARAEVLDGRGKTSSLATEEYIYPKKIMLPWVPKTGPMSATIPGLGRLLETALKRHGGKVPLRRLTQRAIAAAADGFEIGEVFVYCSSLFEGTVRSSADCARLYYNSGRRFKAGERLVQKDLARSLRLVSERGFEVLYSGEVGLHTAGAVNATGPVWAKDDLVKYEVVVRPPLWGDVADHQVATLGPPSRGGTGILKALRWLASAPRDAAERTAGLLRKFVEIFGELDREIGDPVSGTSHFVVIDREGTIVSMSQTIGHFFGSGVVVPGYGVLLNDDISDMERKPGHPNSVGPSKRPVFNMAPTIVFKRGRPKVTLGTPGSLRIFPAITCVLDRYLFEGMDLEKSVAAGRCHWEGGRGFLEGDIPAEIRARIKSLLPFPVDERRAQDLFFGGVHGLELLEDGTIVGVADPRREGVATGL